MNKYFPFLIGLILMFSMGVDGVIGDTNISVCTDMTTYGETYYLTADILNSGVAKCMEFKNSSITLDCQNHIVQGDDMANMGFNAESVNNITIKNCIIKDWDYAGVYVSFITGFYFDNLTITSCDVDSGVYLSGSTINGVINNTIISDNVIGISLNNAGLGGANLITNCLLNNTNNFAFAGTIRANNWNTTKQNGTAIYGNGTEIGGNYWTNATGNYFSDTCENLDNDSFCDTNYTLNSLNIDYLPLTQYTTSTTTTVTTTTTVIAYPDRYDYLDEIDHNFLTYGLIVFLFVIILWL